MLTRRTALMGGIGLASTLAVGGTAQAADDKRFEKHVEIAARFIDSVYNESGDTEVFNALVAEDFIPNEPNELPGRDALYERLRYTVLIESDAHYTIEHMVPDEGGVMVRGYMDADIGGRKLHKPYFIDFAIKDSQIVQMWAIADPWS